MTENIDFSGLTDGEREEVASFVNNLQKQAAINQLVHSLADTCWKKCITGRISQGALDSRETSCATNCVARWLEAQRGVVKALADSEAKKRSGF